MEKQGGKATSNATLTASVKILDRYIIKKFLITFFFIIGIIMSLTVIFDLSEKIDIFIKRKAPIQAIVFDYYLNFLAYYGNLLSGFIVFISVIWFTSRLSQRTEIVAILTSGISFKRMLLPYFIGATVLTLLSLYINHIILPDANKDRLKFEELYYEDAYVMRSINLHRKIDQNTIAYFHRVYPQEKRGNNFSLEKWNNNQLESKLFAMSARWDSLTGKWRLNNYYIRNYSGEREELIKGNSIDTTIAMKIEDFGQRLNIVSSMSYSELNQFIKKKQLEGSDKVPHFLVEKHQRTSYPFATYVLTLIGVCIASRKRRGGIGLHLAVGIVIAMLFLFCIKVTTVGATNSGLNPILSVWIPNLIFLGIGIWLYRKAQK